MTTVLERDDMPFDAGSQKYASQETHDLAVVSRVLLASLSGAAGAIHLVMVPSHFALSTAEGIGFAAAGWIQLSIAVLLLVRTSRLIVLAAVAGNAAAIAAWGFSRIWGLPFGSHAWHAETSSFIDLTAVGLETAFVVAAAGFLFRPTFGRGWDRRRLAIGAVIPVAILGLTSAALASPSAIDHASGSHGGHSAESDTSALVADEHGHEADGHSDDGVAEDVSAAADDHDHSGAAALSGDEDLSGLAMLENGHQYGSGIEELDDVTQSALATQLAETNLLVSRYPNIAAAEAAGYRRSGPFTPGLGTHFTGFNANDLMQGVDGSMSPTLIFDGLESTSPLAGFMYMSNTGSEAPPEGFIGPNDHWHYHTNTCVAFKDNVIEAPLGADRSVTKDQCDEFAGILIDRTGYMVHVWTVPGYESSQGTFSSVNPSITCPDGTYLALPPEDWGYKTSTCQNPGAP